MVERRIIDLRHESVRRGDPIPGAESWTVNQLSNRRDALERDDELYVVGSPEDCRDAADILSDVGFKNARPYKQGLHLWKGEYFPDDVDRLKYPPLLRGYTEDDPENMIPRDPE